MIYQAVVDGRFTWEVETKDGVPAFPGKNDEWSCEALPGGGFSILYNHKSYRAELLWTNREQKVISVKVNGKVFEIAIAEPMDRLLDQMGFQQEARHKPKDLKAPMPGLVLKIMVSPGQAIQKGMPLLVLEAMKMENVFKAAEDAVVKEVKVQEKAAVEKGQVMIVLE